MSPILRIVTVLATFPTWTLAQVYQHLRQQGVTVTQAQVQQAAEQSGWQRLRQTLAERYDLSGAELRVRDEWLVAQLLAQVQALLVQIETGQQLPQEVAVYRYYCRSPHCVQGSFTNLPPGPCCPIRPTARKSTFWRCRCIPGAIRPTGAPAQPWTSPA